jgi:hypothetical protein
MTVLSLYWAGAGARGVALNLAAAASISLSAYGLYLLLGDPNQWIALGIGIYAFVSWVQSLALRDHPTFKMIFTSKALVCSIIAFSTIGFAGYAYGFWMAPFLLRVHGVTTAEAGTILGLSGAIGGWMGITAGEVFSDYLKKRTPRARIWIGVISIFIDLPFAIGVVLVDNLTLAYVFNFGHAVAAAFWIGTVVAIANELVMPRMRATSSAFYILTVTFIGLALGPYTVGKISDAFIASGTSDGNALKYAMLISLVTYLISLFFFFIASRHIEEDENTRIERARAAGEPNV